MAEETVVMDQKEELERKIRAELEAEYTSRLEVEINKISARLQQENVKIVTEAIERYKKELAPPTQEDMQKLLTQEYVEFTVELKHNGQLRKFVIAELSQKVEKKIYKKIKDVLIPFSSELASMSLNMLEGDAAKKIVQIMNTFEPVLDVMAGIAAISLNPYGEEEDITDEWVRENLSSTRIAKIVMAQIEANKMRDFFSLLFRGSKTLVS
jgi:hypothetical protein